MTKNWEEELDNIRFDYVSVKQFIKDLMLTTLNELEMEELEHEEKETKRGWAFIIGINERTRELNTKIEEIKKRYE